MKEIAGSTGFHWGKAQTVCNLFCIGIGKAETVVVGYGVREGIYGHAGSGTVLKRSLKPFSADALSVMIAIDEKQRGFIKQASAKLLNTFLSIIRRGFHGFQAFG